AVNDGLVVVAADNPLRLRPAAALALALGDRSVVDGVVLAIGPAAGSEVAGIGRVLQDHLYRVEAPALYPSARRHNAVGIEPVGDVLQGPALHHVLAEDAFYNPHLAGIAKHQVLVLLRPLQPVGVGNGADPAAVIGRP